MLAVEQLVAFGSWSSQLTWTAQTNNVGPCSVGGLPEEWDRCQWLRNLDSSIWEACLIWTWSEWCFVITVSIIIICYYVLAITNGIFEHKVGHNCTWYQTSTSARISQAFQGRLGTLYPTGLCSKPSVQRRLLRAVVRRSLVPVAAA